MSTEVLATYLNDHLAGSVAALELVDRITQLCRGTEREKIFRRLRDEIEEDQEVLKQLLQASGGKESKVRKAAAWLTEKIGEAKLELDATDAGDLRLLEALEALGLGIQGKLGLWRALEAASAGVPEFGRLDLSELERRARDQFERVETLRLQVARSAIGA